MFDKSMTRDDLLEYYLHFARSKYKGFSSIAKCPQKNKQLERGFLINVQILSYASWV